MDRNRDQMLAGFVALRVDEDPLALRAARVALGTASFRERWRHFWGLGPTEKEVKAAESARKFRELAENLNRRYGKRDL